MLKKYGEEQEEIRRIKKQNKEKKNENKKHSYV